MIHKHLLENRLRYVLNRARRDHVSINDLSSAIVDLALVVEDLVKRLPDPAPE